MVYDLHCHSNASDGELNPQEIIARAISRGVTTLSITDHDTVAAYSAELDYNQEQLKLISGIELSTVWQTRGLHVVGLNIDLQSAELLEIVRQQENARVERAKYIADKLSKRGVVDAYAGAQAIAGDGVLGRPHFAQYLIDIGRVKSMEEAFKKYLGNSQLGSLDDCWPGIEQAVGWIKKAGGVAVVAHPDKYKLTRTKLFALLKEFVAAGGEGFEVVSGNQNKDVTDKLMQACEHFGLYASCGSDFHSPRQTWTDLGKFSPLPARAKPVWSLWEK